MKNALAIVLAVTVLVSSGFGAAAKGLEIKIIDNKVSMQAESVPLARLLRLLDLATGMTSRVPPELANRNVSVRFSNLSIDEAILKIFEGQPLDFVVFPGKSIRVTSSSQTVLADNTPAPYSPPPPQDNVFVEDNPPFVPLQPPMNQAGQPAMIQTPFGAIPNPRAQQQNQQQQGIQPMVAPGQVGGQPNPFGQGLPGFNGSQALPTLQSTPFGGSSGQTNSPSSPFPPSSPGSPGTVRPIP